MFFLCCLLKLKIQTSLKGLNEAVAVLLVITFFQASVAFIALRMKLSLKKKRKKICILNMKKTWNPETRQPNWDGNINYKTCSLTKWVGNQGKFVAKWIKKQRESLAHGEYKPSAIVLNLSKKERKRNHYNIKELVIFTNLLKRICFKTNFRTKSYNILSLTNNYLHNPKDRRQKRTFTY